MTTKWTKTKPTRKGWYWVKGQGHEPAILHFSQHGSSPFFGIQPDTGQLSTEGWEWFSGPIELPKKK